LSGRSEWSGQPVVLPMGLQSSPSTSSPTRLPELTPMVGSKHPHLHWSVAGQTLQGTTTPGSCHYVLDHGNSVRFGVCRQDGSLGGAVPGWPFLQPLLHLFYLFIFGPCSFFGKQHFWVKNFERGGWPHPLTRGHAYLLEVVSTGSISPILAHFG